MDKLLIRGGRQLHGEVRISGAKNAALPEMCATLLTDETVHLHNVPRLHDVATMRRLLDNMGVRTETHGERDVYPGVLLERLHAHARIAKVAGERSLNLPDGLHPTAKGIELIVTRILPTVESFLARIAQR